MYVCLLNPLYYRGLHYFYFPLSLYSGELAGREGRGLAFLEFSMLFIIFGHMGILGVWVGIYDTPTQSTHFLPISIFINDLYLPASTR